MSFSENPYVHMNLVTAPPKGQTLIQLPEYLQKRWEGNEDVVKVHCEACGADDVARGEVKRTDPIEKARKFFDNHIHRSHARTPDDFAQWNWE